MKATYTLSNLQKQPDVLMNLNKLSVQVQVLQQQRPRFHKGHQDFIFQIRAYDLEASHLSGHDVVMDLGQQELNLLDHLRIPNYRHRRASQARTSRRASGLSVFT